MQRRVRIFLQTTFILWIIGITTQAQPALVTEISNGSKDFRKIGNLVYFVSGNSLYRTDGTAPGTILLKSGFTTPPNSFREFKDMLFFATTASELWRSDGTPSGTIQLISTNSIGLLQSTENFLFFTARDATTTGQELYRTDGTPGGTVLVKDLFPGSGDGYRGRSAVVGNELFFNGHDGTNGFELWKTDGTSGGTVMVKDILPGPGDGFGGNATVFTHNNLFYFSGNTVENGMEPWVSDGTAAGTHLLKDMVPGPQYASFFSFAIAHNESVYFLELGQSEYPTGPADLWKTSGTTASTVKIKTLGNEDTDYSYHSFLLYQNKIYFFASRESEEDILWATDGTQAGTFAVFNFSALGRSVNYFDVVNDYILFTGSIPQLRPTPLYRSDGTNEGTREVARFKSGGFLKGGQDYRFIGDVDLTTVGDYAFYADHDGPYDSARGVPHNEEDYFHLFQTDGVTTQSMRTLYGVSTVGTHHIVNYNGKVIFTRRNDQEGSTDTQTTLWIYDPANTPEPEPCAGTGKIIREVWSGIPGKEVSSIPVNSPPTSTSELTIFEGPFRVADNYGARIRGYVCVPTTGNYTFWIASDDRSELWLSTDDNPANKVKIASVGGATSRRQWDKYTSQKSSPIPLTAGRKYYIEALHKESVTYDHVAVGWQLPGGTMERPIPGNRLIPYQSAPLVNITSPEEDESFSAPATVNISANASSSDGSITKVEFYNGTTKLGEDTTSPYAYAWNNVSAGDYTVIAKAIDNLGVSASDSVDIAVTSSCAGTGTIIREVWNGITGVNVSSIPLNFTPSSTSELTLFEGPVNVGDNYGARVRGSVCVPATGGYTFWIASDDYSELWLSSDENPVNKIKIASVTGATTSREWTKYPSQKSAVIILQGGRKYYIEALHKENKGNDNLAVGWQLPDGTMELPIPGSRLSPFASGENQSPRVLITYPENGQAFNQPANITIEVDASDPDGNLSKVEFFEGSNKLGEDVTSPYSFTWSDVEPGTYSLTAKAVDAEGATATSQTINITVNEGGGGCTASGTITREYWEGVSGNRVSRIPVNTAPTSTNELSIFEGPSNIGTNYGTRIRGYICPPISGGYNFWISSNDFSELWLSTDDDPSNKVRIAYLEHSTEPREWDKFRSQLSTTTIWLDAGKRYYVEALHKQWEGADHIAVGWVLPDGTYERPIPGNRLAPFDFNAAASTFLAESTTPSEADERYAEINIFPNPVQSGVPELTISGYDAIHETIETNVEIINITGEVIYAERIYCGGNCNAYLMDLNRELTRGVYMVNLVTNGKRLSRRLLVR